MTLDFRQVKGDRRQTADSNRDRGVSLQAWLRDYPTTINHRALARQGDNQKKADHDHVHVHEDADVNVNVGVDLVVNVDVVVIGLSP